MTRVSVIIPTYNRAKTLLRAIDSALAQTIDDLEVVVVDDGSTDNTESVLAAYDDPRVRPVIHETNQGANVARNTGLEHARGEYVAALEDRSSDWVGVYCDTGYELSGTNGRLRSAAASVLARLDDDPTREGNDE